MHRNVGSTNSDNTRRSQTPSRRNHGRRSIKVQMRESIPAVIIGIILVFAGTGLLFYNEGRCVQITKSLDEGYNLVTKVQSSSVVLEENNDKLVHVWGQISAFPRLTDTYFGVEVTSIKLKRRVQMFQWIEEEASVYSEEHPDAVSDTSYSYFTTWKDKPVDSAAFYISWGHENPKTIPLDSVILTADVATLGAYQLSPAIKERFTDFISFSGDEDPDNDAFRLHSGMYYNCRDLFDPEVGDLRVQFYLAGHAGEIISIIGRQVGDVLHPHITSSGIELLIIHLGKHHPEEMFSLEHSQNRFLTWMVRLGGWFLIFIGMVSVSHIIHSLVECSQLLRDVVHLGFGSAILTLSMSTSLTIIGGAWCFYRPGLAAMILFVAVMPFIRAAIRHHRRPPRSTQPQHRDGSINA